MKRAIKGFSLPELLLTLVILSFIATLGMPSFQGALRNSRLTSSINELATALGEARSEAIKQNRPVIVCRKATASSSTCKTASSPDGWEVGWLVFVDANNNKAFDGTGDTTACATGNDCLLMNHETLPDNLTLRPSANNAINYIRYQPSGLVSNFGAGGNSFYLCDISTDSTPQPGTAKVLVLNGIGRTRMAVDSTGNGIPEVVTGTDINTCTP